MRTAEQVPGVVAAEPWTFASAQRVRADDTTSGNLVVFGLPDGATTVRPVIEEGRFLVPGDGNALVVTRNFLDDEPDVRIGDRVTLRSKGRDADVHAGRHRPVAHPAAVPVRAVGGARHADPRRAARPGC